jgi:solute carrier family 44 (choline transporter-like protein), member 2/4/5
MVLAILISLVFMFCLRCFAGCLVWLSIIFLILLMVALGILFCYNGGAISRDSYIGNLGISIPTLPANSYYNIFGYISFGLAGLFLLLTLCCCSRLRLAVAVCGVAGQFVAGVCQSVLVPIFMGLIIFAMWVVCVIAMICLIGGANFVVHGSDVFTSIDSYTNNYLAMFYYFVFGTLWVNAFLQAITIFVIASACALWYFNQAGPGSNDEKIDSPVCTSYWMAFRFHLGSLAFGSLILAIVEFIQFIVELFNQQAEASGVQNKCTECLTNCLRCCIECLKRII